MQLSEKTIKEYKKDKIRNHHYKHTYKISLDDFRDKLIHQGFKCDICKLRQMFCGKLQVDHCHKTNKIRSLLCARCNKELSRFEKVGSVSQSRSHLVDPNTEYVKYLNQHRTPLCLSESSATMICKRNLKDLTPESLHTLVKKGKL